MSQLGEKFERKTSLIGSVPGKTALVVIDFTNEYLHSHDEGDPRAIYGRAVATTRYLSDSFHEKFPDLRQIWIADNMVADEQEILAKKSDTSLEITPEEARAHHDKMKSLNRAEVLLHYNEFKQKPQDAVFLKLTYSVFEDGWNVDDKRSFSQYLRDENITNLLFCGGNITQCVLATALHAIGEGFNPICLEEALSGSPDDRINIGDEFWTRGITIISAFDVLEHYRIDPQPLREEHERIKRDLPQPPTWLQRFKNFIRPGNEPS